MGSGTVSCQLPATPSRPPAPWPASSRIQQTNIAQSPPTPPRPPAAAPAGTMTRCGVLGGEVKNATGARNGKFQPEERVEKRGEKTLGDGLEGQGS